MKIAVTSEGKALDAAISPVFGRSPVYVFIDLDTMQFEAVDNPGIEARGGAGIQAAQFVIDHGAQAVLTGNVGPNACQVLQARGIPIFLVSTGTVRQAVEAYQAGQLKPATQANVVTHAGLSRTHEPNAA